MGGGFALSKIIIVSITIFVILIIFSGSVFNYPVSLFQQSGLSKVIGDALTGLGSLHIFGIVFLITLMCSFITSLVSNTATVTILTPIMFDLVSLFSFYKAVIVYSKNKIVLLLLG